MPRAFGNVRAPGRGGRTRRCALVDAGANVNLADRNGTTPLALARARGHREMVELLEKAGAR